MRKSKSFLALLFVAVMFLAVSVAFTVSETWASESHAPESYTEYIIEPGGGKVVPPDWCLEHGYIRLQNPDNPYVCPHCG